VLLGCDHDLFLCLLEASGLWASMANPVLLGRFARFLVGEVGVQLELVHDGRDAGPGNDPVKVSGLEIGDAGAAKASFAHEFCQRLPR
jgi:hypothetical protein